MIKTELRIVVEGHRGREFFRNFVACLNGRDYAEKQLADFAARIESPPEESWQPVITFAVLEEREVTDWHTTDHVGTPDPKYASDYALKAKT